MSKRKITFSVLHLVISFLLIASLFYSLGNMNKSSNMNPSESNINNLDQKDLAIDCGPEECLFDDNGKVVGYTQVDAYYSAYDREEGYGSTKLVRCDAIEVINNENDFSKLIQKPYLAGTTRIIGANVDNNAVKFNVDLTKLRPSDAQKLRNSTLSKPIRLALLKRVPFERGVPACYSLFDIVQVF